MSEHDTLETFIPTCEDPSDHRCAELSASSDMEPIADTVILDAPLGEVWRAFNQPRRWPEWNKSFYWAHNPCLKLDAQLIWIFQPIRPALLYKMPAAARIVEFEVGDEACRVTWSVTVLPGFYARHTYHMTALPDGRTRFGSWEKAMGWSFRALRRFWLQHFQFVCRESVDGAPRMLKGT